MNIPKPLFKEIVSYLKRAPDFCASGDECACVAWCDGTADQACTDCRGTGRELSEMDILEERDVAEKLLKKLKRYVTFKHIRDT